MQNVADYQILQDAPFSLEINQARELKDSVDMKAALLLAAIESFTIGLIIADQKGAILLQNKQAKTLLKSIDQSSSKKSSAILWRSCRSLLDSQGELSNHLSTECHIILEDDVATVHSTIHMRVQWFDWDTGIQPSTACFLITLEDSQQTLTAVVNQEIQRYGLTSREAEVWRLKRMEHSYKEIATALYVSKNTVKKHLKSIYSKKEQFGH